MNLHRLVMLPNGSAHEQHWAEIPTADHPDVRQFASLFTGLRCDATVRVPPGELRVVWSGSSGGAIGSFHLDGALFLCVVLATGRDAEEDRLYLSTVGRQWNDSNVVRGLLEGPSSPFLTLHEVTDRPLLVALLVPALAPEVWAALNGVELAVVGAHVAAARART
ncbi:hypothetical protein R5W23_004737 [Gemmata sp. JC673]|uniref:Uncharacterized protein n=1 Tax=Gemmata algarum TaxID=2975278 RepID=A0ABU5F6M5_9BACT|nr:hypothetical protein [Gemmata algarum]MDY3563238.1 hypothetical protein [Gemmata algarum]